MSAPLFQSSGNLIADRRYAFGQELAERGDHAAAADLFAQAVELAPHFASMHTLSRFIVGKLRTA